MEASRRELFALMRGIKCQSHEDLACVHKSMYVCMCMHSHEDVYICFSGPFTMYPALLSAFGFPSHLILTPTL